MTNDLRLIEDYLPIEAISAEASREKSVRKGHISTLHLWWARRPLVACRAAVYGALVPADRWVKDVDVKDPPADAAKAERVANGKKKGLNRKAAKEFVTKLCRYPKTDPTKPEDIKIKRETEQAIADAQQHILEAHPDRLTAELAEARKTGKPPAWVDEFKFKGDKVTYDDIVAGRAPRPRVLDMFAGGGAIPLEALRLGCEAYALDLNPVAHIIELCTLVYPQKYGKPDPNVRGMTGPKGPDGHPTWGGLAAEVRYWGHWVLDRVRKEIGDLYPPIPDPAVWATPPEIAFDRTTGEWKVTKPGKPKRSVNVEDVSPTAGKQATMYGDDDDEDGEGAGVRVMLPPGFLQPVAYLWTRTVRCKNPACGATVPLVRQTWLCKKAKRNVALQMHAPQKAKRVRFEVVESETESGLGFDPAAFSKGGNATCPFCGTVADIDYVKSEGCATRMGTQPMAVVCTRLGRQGKVYLATDDLPTLLSPDDDAIRCRTTDLCQRTAMTVPDEPCVRTGGNQMAVLHYGMNTFGDLFSPRQMLSLLTFTATVHSPDPEFSLVSKGHSISLGASLGLVVSRLANFSCSLCTWFYDGGRGVKHVFARQALPMVWDFAETNPFYGPAASWSTCATTVSDELDALVDVAKSTPTVWRGSATANPVGSQTIDSVVTDPPYYDNVFYANISDFFYVWLKRTVGHLFPDHFGSAGTPKKQEVVADAARHAGDKKKAVVFYEDMMARSLAEAHRALKPGGTLAVVYAHKTTLGWSTLVDALRRAGFVVVEAWPLDTENTSRMVAMDSAALASSILLVGRKRPAGAGVGNYEDDVQPELQQIVRERVETLWDMGIAGADLVIACVGAGLRAFTKYEKVEYANGEEVPAEKFLAEVEGVVLDAMLGKLSGTAGGNVSTVDNASRFYVLWRFVYKTAELDAGEAIVFANGTHVELDGPLGLSTGKDALVEKKKAKYRARAFTERGKDANLGLSDDTGRPAPLIDALHRILWLLENSPRKLNEFLDEARPDRERLRVLAQALAGAALSGKSEEEAAKLVSTTPAEQAALGKLLANWRSVIDSAIESKEELADRKAGQKRLDFK
ncbi:MAG: DUF1156 domain-containing protein [Sedimentisphaerales bacterium]|nr:DUF1156 domain-containing protein [Sedimentisphaerales bacterium]